MTHFPWSEGGRMNRISTVHWFFWFVLTLINLFRVKLLQSNHYLISMIVFLLFQGKFNFPSDVEVSNNARDLMQRCVQSIEVIVFFAAYMSVQLKGEFFLVYSIPVGVGGVHWPHCYCAGLSSGPGSSSGSHHCVIFYRLQNSHIFCECKPRTIFERKVSSQCKNGEGEWWETKKSSHALRANGERR